jgi:hypothetical protein
MKFTNGHSTAEKIILELKTQNRKSLEADIISALDS